MTGGATVRVRIVIMLLLMLFSLSPLRANEYTNKDIEALKAVQKSAPAPRKPVAPARSSGTVPLDGTGGPVYKNENIKNLKTNDANSSYQRSGSQDATARPKTTQETINYLSPDGSLKIEVKPKATAGKKAVQKDKYPPKDKKATKPPRAKQQENPAYLSISSIRQKLLPYEQWKDEYEEYSDIHYNERTMVLTPKMIVLRSTYSPTLEPVWDMFYRGSLYDEGDEGLLYGHLSAHFIIDRNGIITQTLPLNVRSKGAYGVNHQALTIELLGATSQELLENSLQKKALLALLSELMKKFSIPISKIYGHCEVAQGKSAVPEYTEFGDSDYPDFYSPDKRCYDPGPHYVQKLKEHFARQAARGQ
ncbi:MAG: peptidoglycan recognition family protein [Candidatus Eremiobacteraeota bacterium]|nr:peptidoglycan recognition family protein [Candidatus Eremiobacteraeota bacterium]